MILSIDMLPKNDSSNLGNVLNVPTLSNLCFGEEKQSEKLTQLQSSCIILKFKIS